MPGSRSASARLAGAALLIAGLANCGQEEALVNPDRDPEIPPPRLDHENGQGCLVQSNTTYENGQEIVTVTFEGVELPGCFTLTHDIGATFVSMDSNDTIYWNVNGGGGYESYANIPSPTSVAGITGTNRAEIRFDPPVSSVEVQYCSWWDYDFYAYAANGALLDHELLPQTDANRGADGGQCGDWLPGIVQSTGDNIARVALELSIFTHAWAFDNVKFTRTAQAEPCDSIFDNPTGDPFLDTPVVQEALFDAFIKSKPYEADIEQRLEHGGYIYQRSDLSVYTALTTNPLRQTACEITLGNPHTNKESPQDSVLGSFHSHPFSHNDVLPNTRCGIKPGTTARYSAMRYGGGSYPDWLEATGVTSGIPITMYIIDKDKVYRLDPGTAPSDWPNNPNKWPWNPALCSL